MNKKERTDIFSPPPVHALRVPDTLGVLFSVLLGRLPQGMMSLAFITYVRAQDGSFGFASALTSIFVLSSTFGQPFFGRFVDRYGPRWIMILCSVLAALGFFGIVLVPFEQKVLLCLAAGIAGFFTPPLESTARMYWPRMMQRGKQLDQAFSFDLLGQQMVYVLGPLLASLIILYFGHRPGIWAMGLIGVLGAVWFASIRPPRVNSTESSSATDAKAASIFSFSGFLTLLFFLFSIGAPVGVQVLAATTYGDYHSNSSLAGIVFSAYALGGAIGALAVSQLGVGNWGFSRLAIVGFILALGYLPLGFLGLSLGFYIFFTALSGLTLPVALTLGFQLTERIVPASQLTEANGWVIALVNLSIALWTLLAGFFIDNFGILIGIWTGLCGSAVLIFIASYLLWRARKKLL
ncbi:MFS transporter [Actinomycetaceae bacterium TAE3-ERU4]|nr:MFS transporter [Actinomycetaceae bacterium TAE3-ERU4]